MVSNFFLKPLISLVAHSLVIGPKKKRKRVKDGKEEESENSKMKDNEPIVQERGVFYGKIFLIMFKKFVC